MRKKEAVLAVLHQTILTGQADPVTHHLDELVDFVFEVGALAVVHNVHVWMPDPSLKTFQNTQKKNPKKALSAIIKNLNDFSDIKYVF